MSAKESLQTYQLPETLAGQVKANMRTGVVAIKAAQARGDFQAARAKLRRRALRVHLGRDLASGLAELSAAFHKALR